MKFPALTSLSFLCLVLFSQIALPQGQSGAGRANPLQRSGDGRGRLPRALSADHNGFATREDWVQFMMNNPQGPDIQDLTGFPGDMTEWVEQRAAVFARLDANHDGMISRNEWPASARSFRHLDVNNDGILNLEEFMSPNGRFWNQLFQDWDTNGDGVLTKDEWLDSEESFIRVDKDHNGVIDRTEFYCRQ